MSRRLSFTLLSLGLCLSGSMALAVPDDLWLHIRVNEEGPEGETVHVNVPLTLVEKVLPLIDHDDLRKGKLRLGHHDLEGTDLQGIWAAVRDTEDGQFVTVESRHEKVNVAKMENYLIIRSDDDLDKVDVKVPLTVVDALLSGEKKDELNVLAAVRALGEHGEGELVSVEDDESTVRIWVDKKSSGK